MKAKLLLLVTILFFSTNVFSQVGSACWREISAGQNFTLAIKSDGTLWGWGQNSNLLGLGLGNLANQNLPIQIGTANDWMTVSAGTIHSLAVKTNGTLWSWGQSTPSGGSQLINSNVPLQIGTDNNWKEVSINYEHVLAVKNNGTLWAWGLNYLGAIGNGSTNYVLNPVQIGTATNWKQAAAGRYNSLALKTNGSLWAWGNNEDGQLGNGTQIDSLIPIQVGSLTNWDFVSASYSQSFAIKSNGNLWAWGNNNFGFLGNGTNTSSNIPVFVTCPTIILSNETFENSNFSVFPNPTNDFITIKSFFIDSIKQIKIIDVSGKVILNKQNDFENINVLDLKSGLFFIEIKSENEKTTYIKFIKH